MFDPFEIEPLGEMKNRIVMSAMTRNFSPDHVATEKTVKYYEARAAGGAALILTEGVIVHSTADGYVDVPHIQTPEQAHSWRPVVDAVHRAGAKIFCQLWHCGRISHSDFTGGVPPVSSTHQAAAGMNRQNGKPFGTPRALGAEEMPDIYGMFANSARLALDAGFDGVQVHMGHGYLVDQFFDARVNDRKDRYGGTVENRCRFALELLECVLAAVPKEKVMARISPSRDMGGIYDWPDLEEMIEHLIPTFDGMGLRMLDISCAAADYFATSGRVVRMARPLWPACLIGGASLTQGQAEGEVENGLLDLVTWGRSFIANPDFGARLADGRPVKEFDRAMLAELI